MRNLCIVLAITAAVLVCSSKGFCAENDYGNGSWWHSLTQPERTHVVEAMLNTFEEAYALGALQALSAAQDEAHWTNDVVTEVAKRVRDLKFSKGVPYYVEGITAFYAKHVDVADKVDVSQLIACLADSAVTSCDDVAKANAAIP